MVDIEEKVKQLEKRADENEVEHKEILNRLNEKDIADALMRQQLDTVIKTTNRIEQKIDEQTEKPIKRWDNIVNTIITVMVSAIAGGLIGLILK